MTKRKKTETEKVFPLIPAGRVCGACLYFDPPEDVAGRSMVDEVGHCHAYPPEIMPTSEDTVMFSTPPVDRCRLACSLFSPRAN